MADITPEYLRERLRYEPDTGKLFWREAEPVHFKLRRTHLAWNTRFAGKEAGSLLKPGYLYINLKKKMMLAHRIIWAIVHGRWPDQIDHINHIRTDNRIENLRNVSASGNAQNIGMPADNTSGHVGVYWFKARKIWYARIKVGAKNHHLGYFANKADAIAARQAADERFGFHKNHGLPANDNRLLEAAS